jgi:outer membrane protein TolC
MWPTANVGQLGSASTTTWAASFDIEWRLFDGGARKHRVMAAESKRREAQDEMTDKRDRATRDVWSAYIAFRTAIHKEQAAVALLASANASYSANLDAYRYGVKNLVDVVTAEKQLALARLSGVSARSELFLQAVNLEFVTGNLLRNRPPVTRPQTQGGRVP